MDILNRLIQYIINPLVYLMIAVAVMYFLWGVLNFVRNADKPDERATGAQHILWGVIGLAIIFSVFAFIRVIQNTIGPTSFKPTTIGQ